MARHEIGFKGAKLVGAEVEITSAQVLGGVVVPADEINEVDEGTLQETITALAQRIKALEDAAE
ncbi:hypothetical protein [Mycobacteroides abscessus]|uniref:hypothetical protein n=1 Tax=Mycobacteroides abscessus TaxID=36809 RepID=UPI000C2578C6|nr:hypothetical protein [Mycobacteroides abscessus]